ncbi:hypothetical protein Bca4012_066452 [Brassica carinata]
MSKNIKFVIYRCAFLEFYAGEECIITLEYEKLENLCSCCMRLSHLSRDCPERQNSERMGKDPEERSHHSVAGPRRTDTARVKEPYNHRTERVRESPPHYYRNTATSNHHINGKRTSPTHHTKEASDFQRRLDRHGNPFGERVATFPLRAPPLRNKIVPTTENEEVRASRTTREQVPVVSPQHSARRGDDNHADTAPISNSHLTPKRVWQAKGQHSRLSETKENATAQNRIPLE